MTTSVFGWLDQDDQTRNQMLEIIDLFREQGILDELGTAQIRDAFSDRFFPGITTIQTRVRYFLFVPWIHIIVDGEGRTGRDAQRRERELHAHLVQSLRTGNEADTGIIGIRAGESLQRLPGGIYWTGLSAWGIRRSTESVERYDEKRHLANHGDDDAEVAESGELLSGASRYWHRGMPKPPEGLFEQTSFELTLEEAEFLQERVIDSCSGTLLEACVSGKVGNIESASFPWDLDGLDNLDQTLGEDIEHARKFALLAEGAINLYNLMLAERSSEFEIGGSDPDQLEENERRVAEYTDRFTRWAHEIIAERDALLAWDRDAFWDRVRDLRPTLSPATTHFFEAWMNLAISDPEALPRSDDARRLISNRERRRKGSLARLHYLRPLERWSGSSGLGRMTYRWPNARPHVIDILDGLERGSGDDRA